MGHRDSSAHVHEAGGVCLDPSGVDGAVAGDCPVKWARSGSARVVAQPQLGTADSSLHGRPVPQNVDRKESSPSVWFLLAAIRFYQALFAPMMPLGCKFYPSCSRYAAEAIARHGAIRGVQLALARLWRCRPFTQGGVDLVPEAAELSHPEEGSEVRP